MQFSDVQKLLETDWGQVVLIAGLLHILWTNKSQTGVLKELVNKITELDKHISVNKALNQQKENKIKELETRVRFLEIGHNKD